MKMRFHSQANLTHFHTHGCTTGLVFIDGLWATQQWTTFDTIIICKTNKVRPFTAVKLNTVISSVIHNTAIYCMVG